MMEFQPLLIALALIIITLPFGQTGEPAGQSLYCPGPILLTRVQLVEPPWLSQVHEEAA